MKGGQGSLVKYILEKNSANSDYIAILVEEIFTQLDLNNDGYITSVEILMSGGDESDLEQLRLADANGDEVVSRDELYDYLSKYNSSQSMFSGKSLL